MDIGGAMTAATVLICDNPSCKKQETPMTDSILHLPKGWTKMSFYGEGPSIEKHSCSKACQVAVLRQLADDAESSVIVTREKTLAEIAGAPSAGGPYR